VYLPQHVGTNDIHLLIEFIAKRVDPGEAMFVGDSVRDDVVGAAAVGMQTCLATWYRRDPESQGRGVTVGTEPLHVVEILERIVESGRAGKI